MIGADLALLLREANGAQFESLSGALAMVSGQPPPRVAWLAQHIFETKRDYWSEVAVVVPTISLPDLNLDGLCAWEVEQAGRLTPQQLATDLASPYADETRTVADILRLNARHTTWHAGQIAALGSTPRLA